jgi:hypothetical protein
VVLFCGFFFQVGRLVLGEDSRAFARDKPGVTLGPEARRTDRPVLPERLDLAMGTTLVAAAVAVVSAFYLPDALVALIRAAVRVVEGA